MTDRWKPTRNQWLQVQGRDWISPRGCGAYGFRQLVHAAFGVDLTLFADAFIFYFASPRSNNWLRVSLTSSRVPSTWLCNRALPCA